MRLTTARLMSGSMSANAAMAVFGSVSVTAFDGASNFRGRPRRGSRAAIGVGIFENISPRFGYFYEYSRLRAITLAVGQLCPGTEEPAVRAAFGTAGEVVHHISIEAPELRI